MSSFKSLWFSSDLGLSSSVLSQTRSLVHVALWVAWGLAVCSELFIAHSTFEVL